MGVGGVTHSAYHSVRYSPSPVYRWEEISCCWNIEEQEVFSRQILRRVLPLPAPRWALWHGLAFQENLRQLMLQLGLQWVLCKLHKPLRYFRFTYMSPYTFFFFFKRFWVFVFWAWGSGGEVYIGNDLIDSLSGNYIYLDYAEVISVVVMGRLSLFLLDMREWQW